MKNKFFRLLILALSFGAIASCQKNGKGTVTDANTKGGFISDPNVTPSDGAQSPGAVVAPDISFYILDNSKKPVPNVSVDFEIFDVTALNDMTDSNIVPLITQYWDTKNPIFYSDSTTTRCDEKVGGTECTKPESIYEKSLAAYKVQADWLGELSGAVPTSDTTGKVSVSYRTPNIFARTIAIAMRVKEGGVAAGLVQVKRIKTYTLERYLQEAAKNPLNATFTFMPQQVIAGRDFTIQLNTSLPDGVTDPLEFTITTEDVPHNDAAGTAVPSGKISCTFVRGVCVVPGGPFKVMSPGTFHLSLAPGEKAGAIKGIDKLPVLVEKGKASRLMISSTPPDKTLTPICQNIYDVTKKCLIVSADVDNLRLYPALIDDGNNYVGPADSEWFVEGPLAGRFDNAKATGVQLLKPLGKGEGTITVKALSGANELQVGFNYVVVAGTPTHYTVKLDGQSGITPNARAVVPFRTKLAVFDRKGNACDNYSDTISVTVGLVDALPSVPPANSGWTAMQPDVGFTEDVHFADGVATTTGTLKIAKVPVGSDPLPRVQVEGGLPGASATTPSILVTHGDLAKTLLRTETGGLGSVWSSATVINTDLTYVFYVGGYDAAGNYAQEVFSKFYGVDDTSDINVVSAFLKDKDPTYYMDGMCPSPPATQPSPIFCPVHRSLVSKSGAQTYFVAAGDPGTGRVLAIPQNFGDNGALTVAPTMSASLSIQSGTAVKLSFHITDKVTGNVVSTSGANTPQVTAGQLFRVTIEARDGKDIVANSFTGSKKLTFISSAKTSWGGVSPTLPSGDIVCVFSSGICQLPTDYILSNVTEDAAISVQDITDAPAVRVPDVWSTLVHVLAGAESRIYVTDRKGGPAAGATILATEMTVTADQESPMAAAVTDAYGNWIRDLAANEGLWDGTVDITTVAVPNATNTWTSSEIFKAIVGNGMSNVLKFLPPSDSQVFNNADRDSTKYDVVYQPADRTGFGYIVVKSSVNAALVAYPTPKVTVKHGAIDHVETIDTNHPTTNFTESNSLCFIPRIRLHDKKHNVIEEYTLVTQMAVKFFTRGAVDPHAGDFSFIQAMIANTQPSTSYAATNTGMFPTVVPAGIFQVGGSPNFLGGGPSHNAFADPMASPYLKAVAFGDYIADWWYGSVAFIGGEAQFPGQFCFTDARKDTNSNYADREVQVELPAAVIAGVSMPAVI